MKIDEKEKYDFNIVTFDHSHIELTTRLLILKYIQEVVTDFI